MDHGNHTGNEAHNKPEPARFGLSISATLHCLLGCGIGEVVGIIIGTALAWSNVRTIVLAIILGFFFGFLLGIAPLLRAGFGIRRALRQVFIAESLSIAVMEAAEVLVEVYTPGVMNASLTSLLFWVGMLLALTAGFIAAFPINYYLIGKGVRHQH